MVNTTRYSRHNLMKAYRNVRSFTIDLVEPLQIEDYVIQTMPDVSPTKWHLAHTTWFFETFVLEKAVKNYKSYNPLYNYLFNSYYVQVGERWHRPSRGLLSRPTVKDIYEYRKVIDRLMLEMMEKTDEKELEKFGVVIEIGLNHEQQHQELILTDIKHVLSVNPLHVIYHEYEDGNNKGIEKLDFIEVKGGLVDIGYTGHEFFYDNEKPSHKVFLKDYKIANRLITNGEYIDFIEDGGYKNIPLWLSDGAAIVEAENWNSPLYWEKIDDEWWYYTLNGFKRVNPNEPVTHVSLFEADAFAQWKGARLLTEFEWENAANNIAVEGNFVEDSGYHPRELRKGNGNIHQMFGDVWEWTRSDYSPYPGYKIPKGAIGEYNGKFMSGQNVLRGGSCATTGKHIRKTYRNFFYPKSRWQFSGIRLAKDI